MRAGTITRRFEKQFPDNATCVEHFASIRFRNGRYCPYCGSMCTYKYEKPDRYRCGSCKKDFSATSNTIFESAHLGLRQYFIILAHMTQAKEAIPLRDLIEAAGATEKSVRRAVRLLKAGLGGNICNATGAADVKGKIKHAKANKRS